MPHMDVMAFTGAAIFDGAIFCAAMTFVLLTTANYSESPKYPDNQHHEQK